MTTFYPKRQRCASCRQCFGALVLAGQWCSYECAGVPAPSRDPTDWPRQHFRRGRLSTNYDQRFEKSVFLTEEAATLAALGEQTGKRGVMVPYLCDYCLMWHVGHVERVA